MRSLALACVSALIGARSALACVPHWRRAGAPARAAPTLPLGHAGRWITDARGRVVIVHGINMVYKLAPVLPGGDRVRRRRRRVPRAGSASTPSASG